MQKPKARNAIHSSQTPQTPQKARMDLVIALYEARRAAGLTQKELAERLGTNQTYVAALEKGRKNITFSTLARYARACGKRVAVTLL